MPSVKSKIRFAFSCFSFLALLISISNSSAKESAGNVSARPTQWAVPLEVKGLPNLHRVDINLYRSAQPEDGSGEAIKSLGIKTVLNLREHDKDIVLRKTSGIGFKQYPLHTWDIDDRDIVAVLKIITNPTNQPILVHCAHGADRTGLMMASYRMIVQGWSKEDARKEMKQGGYEFHAIWKNIDRRIDKMDIAKMRSEIFETPLPGN
ncbi:MAG: dual specificity protein phosphatase family protein [Arenimonas sp.]